MPKRRPWYKGAFKFPHLSVLVVLATSLALCSLALIGVLRLLEQPQVSEKQVQSSEKQVQGAVIDGWPRNPSAIDDFNRMVGSNVGVVTWYERFGEYNISRPKLDNVRSKDATPHITLEPSNVSLQSIANGRSDAWIDDFATMLADYDGPVLVRFAHEMNGSWYPWGQQPNDYKAAFKRVSNRIEAKAPKAKMVFSPSVDFPIARYYPGDAYVDWLGLDGYNFDGNRSPRDVFARSYDELAALNPNKPIMIGETGSTQYAGKDEWITDLYTDVIPNRMPRIKMVVWFNLDKERDWRVNSSRESLEAYRDTAGSQRYQGELLQSTHLES